MAESATPQDVAAAPLFEPSIRNALPYFAPIAIFPFIICAAAFGGWWLIGPFIFIWFTDQFDTVFGEDLRNMNPRHPGDSRLYWYKLAVWIWVALYPVTLIFAFRQVFTAGHLAFWEGALIVIALGAMARMALNAGHDMMHRRAVWERRIGEVLMASVSFPQEITEHIFVHHALIGTPKDSLSPPKGLSFWRYLPSSVGRSYLDAWRVERSRLRRRRLPVWHYTNPIWRYFLETAAWYALAFWIGGVRGIIVFAIICMFGIIQLRMADYIQHYGLQRIRLPDGRYDQVRPRHSWSAAYQLSNWLYYNSQRHADHHLAATRLYPLLQHCGEDESPRLPGSYSAMGSLLMFPKRWFAKMDPLVDEWRARFYPQVSDWRAYDSRAYRVQPDAYEAITEVFALSPKLAEWMNKHPELLDGLLSREFTDLDLPAGFGPDPDFEAFARKGLARVYWTHEFDTKQMLVRISEIPVQSVREAVETARVWSNEKAFQVCIHVLRGNLSPAEAGIAFSNIAEASIVSLLSTVEDYSGGGEGSFAAVMLGDSAGRAAVFGGDLEICLLHDGSEALCRRALGAVRAWSENNLLYADVSSGGDHSPVCSLADFQHDRMADSIDEITFMRRIFASTGSDIGRRFDQVRLAILTSGGVSEKLPAESHLNPGGAGESGLLNFEDAEGGFRDIGRAARILQFRHAAEIPELLNSDLGSIFRLAGERGLIAAEAAEKLAEAGAFWSNLRGALKLVAVEEFSNETVSPEIGAFLAASCGCEDFAHLDAAIRRMAASASVDLEPIVGQRQPTS
ncbi:MAG: fatty acid desaturase [Rhodobacteraceae bacterium]|nr:fatty acid desaturase [Paracoccaceae bacterium]